jgi:hypothetical protein
MMRTFVVMPDQVMRLDLHVIDGHHPLRQRDDLRCGVYTALGRDPDPIGDQSAQGSDVTASGSRAARTGVGSSLA